MLDQVRELLRREKATNIGGISKGGSGQVTPESARVAASCNRGTKPILIICFIGFCLTLLAYAPGYMSSDSVFQFKQARSGVFSDHHPPLMSAIWSVTDRISAGPFGMLMLQALLFWGGIGVFFIHIDGAAVVRTVCAALVGFFPPAFGQIGTIWKDVFMLSVFLLSVGLMAQFQRKKGVAACLAIFCLLAIGCSMRHNAWIAVPPLVFWLAHAFGFVRARDRAGAFVCATFLAIAGSILVFLASFILSRQLTSTKSHLWQYLAVYDLAGMSLECNQVLFPDDSPVLTQAIELEDLKAVYTSRSLMSLHRDWTDESGKRERLFVTISDEDGLSSLFSLWVKSAIAYPRAYLRHRWAVYSHVVGLTSDAVWDPFYRGKIRGNDFGIIFHQSDLNDAITNCLRQLAKTPLYRVWVYLVILFALIGVGTGVYLKMGSPVVLALSSSGLLYALAYFFFAPSADFRYSLWSLVMAIMCLCYLVNQMMTVLPGAAARRRRELSVMDRCCESEPQLEPDQRTGCGEGGRTEPYRADDASLASRAPRAIEARSPSRNRLRASEQRRRRLWEWATGT